MSDTHPMKTARPATPAVDETAGVGDYAAGTLVQASYTATGARGDFSMPDALRARLRAASGWEARMNAEADYWHELLSQYQLWKRGEEVSPAYAEEFKGYSKGARMILDIRLEHCEPIIGHPLWWRVRWLERAHGNLESRQPLAVGGLVIAAVLFFILPLWVSIPLVAGAVLTFGLWLRLTRACERRAASYRQMAEAEDGAVKVPPAKEMF